MANAIGFALLAVLLLGYCIAGCVVLDMNGLARVIPLACALSVSALAFVFTLFKTNGYLFGLKDTDLLMSFPLEASTIAAVRFCLMYLKALPWYCMLSVSLLVGYGVAIHPPVGVYVAWLVLMGVVPIIPMLAAAFVGFVVMRVSAGMRLRAIVQTILMVAVTLLFLSLRLIIEGMAASGAVTDALGRAAEVLYASARLYLPAAWFANAITGSVLDGLLLVVSTVLVFAAVFSVVGGSIASINAALAAHVSKRDFSLGYQRQHSATFAMVHKEWRRLTGSAIYLTNSIIGLVMAIVIGVFALFVDFSQLVAAMHESTRVDVSVVQPAIPFAVHLLCGMVATTACSPSLEGRSYWVIRSMPIESERVFRSKILFNWILTAPPSLFTIACLCLSARVPLSEAVLYLMLGLLLCACSSAWGCVCGIRYLRLDWKDEVEVVKGGAAMGVYVLSTMIVMTVAMVLAGLAGRTWGHVLVAIASLLLTSLLTVVCYRLAMSLARRV